MGVTIYSRNNEEKKVSMGYIRFGNVRIDIANAYNSEIGSIYQSHYNSFDSSTRASLEKRFDSILSIANRKTKLLMRFLSASDCGASATRTICKIIFELKDKVIEMNLKYEEYIKDYIIPFFDVVEDGCKKGIKWC